MEVALAPYDLYGVRLRPQYFQRIFRRSETLYCYL